MAEPTITDQPDLPQIQDLPAHEFREVRAGKTVAEVVAARPAAEVGTVVTDDKPVELQGQPARDDAGRFVPKAAGEPKADVPAPSKAGNPRHDPKARVDELKTEIAALAKEKGETKAERDAITAELTTLRAERDALKAPAANGNGHSERKADAPAGKLEYPAELKTFDAYADTNPDASYEEYMDARGDFRTDEREKTRRAADADTAAKTAYDEAHKPFWEREKAFKAITPDYDDVIQRSPIRELALPVDVIDLMRTAENGPALRYYLAQHPAQTQQIASMSGPAAVDYLKSLVTSMPVASAVTTGVAPKTKADPPFETVGASAAASTHSLETVAATGSAPDYRRLRESGVRR